MRNNIITGGIVIKKISFVCFLLIHVWLSTVSAEENVTAIDEISQAAIDDVISKVRPALVRIHAVTAYDDQGRKAKYESAGSGVIITTEGHVVTNHHVAGKARRIVCTLASKEEVEADLVGTDPLSDISVIKLRNPEGLQYPTAQFGNSDKLRVGDHVFAMGSPMALSQSVTMGIVSNTELVLPDVFGPFKFTLEGEDVGSIVRWIGHDAPIFPGNSGGPLVDLDGTIVGINEISLGISGAIPGNLAQDVALELIDRGRISRSWIGLEVQPLLKSCGTDSGVLVSGTIEGSPAEKVGIKPGDILIRFNERPISVRFPEELPSFNQLVMNTPVGTDVRIIVIRDGKKKTLNVKTEEREYKRSEAVEIKEWGITVRNISYLAAKEMKRDNKNGALVTSVKPSGPAGDAKPGLEWNDVIVEVNGEKVNSVDDLIAITSRILDKKDEPVHVLVMFERSNDRYITVVKIGVKELIEQGEEISKAWLGIALQVVTREIADKVGRPELKGVRVTRVFKNMPADKAGIEVGDIITAVNGNPVDASEPSDFEVLSAIIRRYAIGTTVSLAILRNDRDRKVDVTLGSSPEPAREMKKYKDKNFEFTVRDIAFMDRVTELWPETQTGVIVENVSTGSWAALANLLESDLIIAVDGKEIKGIDEFKMQMDAIENRQPKVVVLKIVRGIHTYFVEMEPDWKDSD
jgi:serine protease Do